MNAPLPDDGTKDNNSNLPPNDSNSAPKIKLPGLEYFEEIRDKPPQNFLEMLRPLIGDEILALSGDGGENLFALFSGIIPEEAMKYLGKTFPEWVRKASKIYLEAAGFGFFENLPNLNPASLGTFAELFTMLPPELRASSPAMNASCHLADYAKLASFDMPIKQQEQFVKGRTNATKIPQKIKNMTERTAAFTFMVFHWREVEKVGSQAKIYQWLKDNKIISPYTSDAQVRRWFREINLPKGKAGRPPKNTDTSK